jgi:very-short-patch-repair endonuclease
MAHYDRELAKRLAAHHGVITASELAALNVTENELRALRSSGRLSRSARGVYVAADAAPDDIRPWVLACAATGGTLCGLSAGKLWDFRKVPSIAIPTVLVDVDRRIASKLAVVIRTRCLEELDLVVRDDGFTVTSPPRTVFDLAGLVGNSALESIIEQALDRQLFTLATLRATGERLTARGRTGSSTFSNVLGARDASQKPVDSDLELQFERALLQAGAPRPFRQHELKLDDKVMIHADFAWPDLRLLVEVDHAEWHAGRAESAADKWRDRKVARLGWTAIRVTDTDIKARLNESVADVLALIAQAKSHRSVA